MNLRRRSECRRRAGLRALVTVLATFVATGVVGVASAPSAFAVSGDVYPYTCEAIFGAGSGSFDCAPPGTVTIAAGETLRFFGSARLDQVNNFGTLVLSGGAFVGFLNNAAGATTTMDSATGVELFSNAGLINVRSHVEFYVPGSINTGTVQLDCNGSITGTFTGNPAAVSPDCTAPVVTPTLTGTLGSNGWYTSNVGVSWNVTDPQSPITATTGCVNLVQTTDTAETTYLCSATSVGGTGSNGITVYRDTTSPTGTFSAKTADGAPYVAGTWTWQSVTVTATCTDATSGVAQCPAPQTFSADGSATATGQVKDNAGLSASISFGPIRIDTTPPTVTSSAKTADGAPYVDGTWTSQPVTVMATCADEASGVAQCPAPQTFSFEGEGNWFGLARDNAGNASAIGFGPIRIDRVAPTATATAKTADGAPYLAGTWTSQAVTVTFACADATSGVATCASPQVITPDGTFTAIGQAKDNAGNTTSVSFGPIQIDKTGPTETATAKTAEGATYVAGTWTSQAVTVTFACADTTSGVATCATPQVITPDGTFTAIGEAKDNAGNTSNVSFGPIKIDKTGPTATATAKTADGATYVAGTWTSQAVTVTYTCADTTSGVATCPAPQTFSGEGSVSATGQVKDNAGNTATVSFGPIKIDATAPTVVLNGPSNGATYTTSTVPAATCTTTDTGSGVATNATLSTTGGPTGTVTASCVGGLDNAGNAAAPVSAVYSVNPTGTTADLKLAITAPAKIVKNHDVTITVTVTNSGPAAATSMITPIAIVGHGRITAAPGGKIGGGIVTYTATTLASGATATYTITVHADTAGIIAIGGLTGSRTSDPKLLNNIAAALVTVTK